VKVKRPGVQVSARKGYTAPGDTPPQRKALERFADATMSPDLVALLARPVPAGGLTFAATAMALPGAENNVRVVIEIAPGALPAAASADVAENEIELGVLGVDAAGRTSRVRKGRATISAADAPAIAAGGLRVVEQLALPPGRHQVRVALREKRRNTSGLVICDLDIPEADARGLILSSPIVGAASATRLPSLNEDERLASGLGDVPPTTARIFEPGDAVRAVVEVSDGGGTAGAAAVTATVRNAQGRVILTQSGSAPHEPGRPGRQVFDLPIDDTLPPGRYGLRFEARRDGPSAQKAEPVVREVAFEVRAAVR
jgi:hypothetical protein